MGLSGRRRAKKETRSTSTIATIPAYTADSHQPHRKSQSRRTGNTYRRPDAALARRLKRTNLLAVEVTRGWGDHLLPARQATHPDIGASPNANLYSRKMARLLGNDFTNDVIYSLNKKSRWAFAKELRQEYSRSEELREQNLFIVESEARGLTGGAVKKLSTNTSYILDAAEELRSHKRDLGVKCSYQAKQQVLEQDRFQFSDRIRQSQTERQLVTTKAAVGAINDRSVHRATNLWNHLYNVSPSAEEVRMAVQRDYEGRTVVRVGTCVPCRGVDTNRCVQTEKLTRCEKLVRQGCYHLGSKLFESRAKRALRGDMDLQMEADGKQLEVPEVEVEAIDMAEESTSFSREVTLFDAMRPKLSGSINRAKKLAIKERRMMKLERLQQKKRRNNSDETAGASSGYDSGRDDGEYEMLDVEPDAATVKEAVDARLSEAVEAALMTERPTVRVAKEAADEARLVDLFGQQLAVGNSLPRKLAVMLAADLSETVVFEEVTADSDAAVATFAIHHSSSSGAGSNTARTSALEVASQSDPFEFLAGLVVVEALGAVESQMKQQQEAEHATDGTTAGWRRAKELSESEARLAAIRELPMFSAARERSDEDEELVPRSECEICCQQLQDSGAFADGSTMLIGCGHRFCNGCWLHHVASSVARGRADVTCPGYRCQSALDAATLLWFCPSDLLPALAAAAFRAWLSGRRQHRRRRHCPQPNCGRLLECRGGVNAVCGGCGGGGFCLSCGQEPHWPSDCGTAALYRQKMESLGHVKLFLRDLHAEVDVNAKQCPTCRLVMEKGVGCNHMSCPCGEQFCWWCGQSMKAHNGQGACIGSSGRGKSGFLVQRVFTARDSVLVPNSSQSRLYCEAVKMRLYRQSAPLRVRACRQQLTDLFASYAIRFQQDGGGGGCSSWQEAKRHAQSTASQLIDTSIQASYLVEFSYAHLDRHPGDKRARTAVRALGSHVSQLVESMTSEMKQQCRLGYQGPRRTKAAADRLLMMLGCLQSRCKLLHAIVAAHRDRRKLIGRAVAK